MSDGRGPVATIRRNPAGATAAWSARHRGTVICAWLLFVIAACLAGGLIGQRNLTDAQMGNGSSGQATRIYEQAFPYHTGEEVLIQGRGSVRLGNVAFTSAVTDLIDRLRALHSVSDIQSPLAPGHTALQSGDGRSMLLTFSLAGDSNQAQNNVAAALTTVSATARAYPQLRIEEFGPASANKALIKAYDHDFQTAEHTSLPVTLLILVMAFGSLVAAGVPLMLGLTAVIAALGLIAPLSHLIPVAQGQTGPVVLLIGLAVGVDYSMFYLRRKLEERHTGADGRRAEGAEWPRGRSALSPGTTKGQYRRRPRELAQPWRTEYEMAGEDKPVSQVVKVGPAVQPAPFLPVLVRDVMTRHPVTVEPAATVKDIAHILLDRDIRCVPVVDVGDILIGVVSESDLICREGYPTARRHHLADFVDGLSEHRHHWSARAEGLTAGEIMTSDLVTCRSDEPVAIVTRRMMRIGIRTLPVVDSDRLVGVISRHDLLRLFDRPDSEIRDRIEQLLADPLWAPAEHSAEFSVRDGVVTLSGSVRRQSDASVLGAVVRQVPGVIEVVDRLSARRPDPKSRELRPTDWH